MKLMLFAAAASALAFTAAPAFAQGGYGQLSAGLSVNSKVDVNASVNGESGSEKFDLNNGWLVSGALGSQMGPLRGEAEVLYTHNEVSDSAAVFGSTVKASQWALLGNVIYDIPVGSKVTPYVGAGLGFGRTRLRAGDEDDSDDGLAWQLKAGITIHRDSGMNFDVGYRYIQAAKWEATADLGDGPATLKVRPELHVLAASVRFPLGGAAR